MPHSVSPTQENATPFQPKLFVNDGPLENYSWLQPSQPDEPLEELRRKKHINASQARANRENPEYQYQYLVSYSLVAL